MNTQLNTKLKHWHQHPSIQAKGWLPRLFWVATAEDAYATPKVDPREVEVLFATILHEPSDYLDELNHQANGRGTFIAANARRHELPLLTRL